MVLENGGLNGNTKLPKLPAKLLLTPLPDGDRFVCWPPELVLENGGRNTTLPAKLLLTPLPVGGVFVCCCCRDGLVVRNGGLRGKLLPKLMLPI